MEAIAVTDPTALVNVFADPAGLSLHDVVVRVEQTSSLPTQRKREIVSAVHSACTWFHRTPGEVPANHEFLRRRFDRLSPGALGVGLARFRNVRSLIKKGLCAAGIPTSGRNYLAPLTPDWQTLLDQVKDSYARECLARFARFAGNLGIGPTQVDDGVVQAFQASLTAEDMTARPDAAAQSAVRIWNRLVDQEPLWPPIKLTPLTRRERYTLTWDQLSAPLVADVDRYLSIQSGRDPTDPLTPIKPLKAKSIATRRYQLLQLISALHHQGERVEDYRSLADLCDIELVGKAVRFFVARHRDRHGQDASPATSMIHGIADAIRCVAKHYVKPPQKIIDELSRRTATLKPRDRGMSEKARSRLMQVQAPLARKRFLCYALNEMRELAKIDKPTRQDALRFSVLLAIEILFLAPLRIENIAELDLDRHFIWPPGDVGDIGLMFARSEVKNEQPLHYKIPGSSAAALRAYLKRFRPLLLTTNSSALFPGRGARPKRQDSLSRQIKALLKSELGLVWHPHLFRHFCARTKLAADPGDFEGARRLLGHRRIETTTTFYEGMQMEPAVDRYDHVLESIRGPIPFGSSGKRRPRQSTKKG